MTGGRGLRVHAGHRSQDARRDRSLSTLMPLTPIFEPAARHGKIGTVVEAEEAVEAESGRSPRVVMISQSDSGQVAVNKVLDGLRRFSQPVCYSASSLALLRPVSSVRGCKRMLDIPICFAF